MATPIEEESIYADRLANLGFRLIPVRIRGEDITVRDMPPFDPVPPPWCIVLEHATFVTDENGRNWMGPAGADIAEFEFKDITEEYERYRKKLQQSDSRLS